MPGLFIIVQATGYKNEWFSLWTLSLVKLSKWTSIFLYFLGSQPSLFPIDFRELEELGEKGLENSRQFSEF